MGPIADNADFIMGIYHPTPDPEFIQTPYQGLQGLADQARCVCVHAYQIASKLS